MELLIFFGIFFGISVLMIIIYNVQPVKKIIFAKSESLIDEILSKTKEDLICKLDVKIHRKLCYATNIITGEKIPSVELYYYGHHDLKMYIAKIDIDGNVKKFNKEDWYV